MYVGECTFVRLTLCTVYYCVILYLASLASLAQLVLFLLGTEENKQKVLVKF